MAWVYPTIPGTLRFVARKGQAVEKAADELYGLPPGEFTRARDARVKELRKEGDREAADAVKALRKPTVAAWALNQLARARSKDVDRLLAAGKELRSAQEELLGGGDRAAFQEAAAAERDLVAKLSADATALASEAGERGSGVPEKVAATLHAAALDEDTGDELRAGRLVREREAIGGFGEAAAATAPASRSGARAKARPKKAQARPKAAARSDRDDAEQRQRLAAAKTDERHARRELDAAAKALEHAQERADAAKAHAAEAAERARTTAERLKEAKRSEAAARKAHSRAERALETAERGSTRTS
jgi:hypothetical protein